MGININLPNITSTTPDGKIQQLQSYLYQMAEQLNWALNTIETEGSNTAPSSAIKIEQSEGVSPQEAENTFNSIKALIIKSADIVKAYEETITNNFKGKYFADSDFGTYVEETSKTVVENSKYGEETYSIVQEIKGKVKFVEDETLITKAYIRRGFLDYDKETGEAIYGVAVGETNDDGTYKKHAWFTADKLSFFDENDIEVAYISQNKLYITNATFMGTVQFGHYKVDTSDGLAFTWIE